MARKNRGDAIATDYITFSGTTVATIPAVPQASRAIVQFYTDSAGVVSIGTDVMAYQPLIMLTENGDTPQAGFTSQKGFGIYQMGLYELETAQNIANAKFIPFAAGYTVYCKITYYK